MIKRFFAGFCTLLLIGSCGYFKKNTSLNGKEEFYLYIPTGSTYDQVMNIVAESGVVIDMESFKTTTKTLNYKNKIKPGRYQVKDGMSNQELVRLLGSGKQTPVKLSFHYVLSKEALAGKISRKIEADSVSLLHLMNDREIMRNKYGLDTQTALALFIPDTYELYWNTSAQEFADKMFDAYTRFWTKERIKKANQLGLTNVKAVILASIVQGEQAKYQEEWPVIAGVYLNRLKKGMLLQADPTVKYANGDMALKRIYFKHLEKDHPYNTYKYQGLPPGPILLPEKSAVDAVLNPDTHDYLFMCAKHDLSGKHNFAKTLSEHEQNAQKYRAALDKQGIH